MAYKYAINNIVVKRWLLLDVLSKFSHLFNAILIQPSIVSGGTMFAWMIPMIEMWFFQFFNVLSCVSIDDFVGLMKFM